MLKLLPFFWLALLAASCGLETNPASRLDIVGGTAVTEGTPAFTATVSLSKIPKGGSVLESFCSGTLIAPKLILTAAHCVEGLSPESFVVRFDKIKFDKDGDDDKDDADEKEETDAKKQVFFTRAVEDFKTYLPAGSRYFPNYDIAWVRMTKEAPTKYRPAEILRSSDRLQALLNQKDALLLAGFGRTETNCLSSDPKCLGTRLQTRNLLSRFLNAPHFVKLLVIGPNPGHGTCSGDSGGSVFALIDRRWYLLGNLNGKNFVLNSDKVWNPNTFCEAGESIYTFAGDYVDWLKASSGVAPYVEENSNPRGPGLLPIDAPASLGANPGLSAMMRYNNPSDPLWATMDVVLNAFGDEDKRGPRLIDVATVPASAEAAMRTWTTFKYKGTTFDLSTRSDKGRQLSDIRPIARLQGLTRLELVSNRFTDVTPLGQLVKLEDLTLGDNYILETDARVPFDVSFLGRLTRLRSLNLSFNVDNLDLGAIPWDKLKNLETLILNSNNTLDLTKIDFTALPKLTTLTMSLAKIEDLSPLAQATSLRELDVHGNAIRDIKVLEGLPNLQKIDLRSNPGLLTKVCPVPQATCLFN